MQVITWTPVFGYEDRYMINQNGEVKSISREKINSIGRNYFVKETPIKPFMGRGGYWTVKFVRDGKSCTKYVHRLLGLTFLENPLNKPMVNHKNGNKTDNWLENLEWVTRSENHKHAILMNLCKPPHQNSKAVKDRCTGKVYKSMFAASVDKNIPYDKIKYLLKHKSGTCLEFAA